MPKICFIESQSYSVFSSNSERITTGGESVQHTLLAREFAARGWEVSMVSMDVGQVDGDIVDGVQVWKTYRQNSGLPMLRFVYPRLYRNWRALANADADIYFQSCAGLMTGLTAKYSKVHSRHMIFRVAHDTDCIPGQQLVRNARDRRIYEYGLKRSGVISAQSGVQADLLLQNYGLKSDVVNMIAEIPSDTGRKDKDIDVLWVNNFRAFKRPEIVPEIARRLPHLSFAMIGGRMRGDEGLFDRVKSEARDIPNLNFVGGVPYNEVNSYFERAKLFLNTSDSEGFPNSFLQALVRRVPIVTYFDPDGLISKLDMGVAVAAQDQFEKPLQELMDSKTRREEMGGRGHTFVLDHYSPQAIVADYERLIDERFDIRLDRA